MKYLPLLIFIVVVVGLFAFTARARRRQAGSQAERALSIGVGTEVMTTSGLYGTVVARNDDDTVLLAIAPGVEVRWAVAALRTVDSLPDRYRRDEDEADASDDVDLGKRPDDPGTAA